MIAKINWKPSSLDLKKFGITIFIGFALIGGVLFWKDWTKTAVGLWIGGTIIGLEALLLPLALKPFYFGWMGIAFVMGSIISAVFLFLTFYFIIVPTGLVLKIIGRDFLKIKTPKEKSTSFWTEIKPIKDKSNYERLS